GSSYDEGFGVVITSEEKIVVGGDYSNGTNSDYAAVRYNSNGTLDTTFSGDGKATAAIGAGDDEGRGVAVQSDGKVIVIGATDNGTDMDFGIVRFNSNGTLDTDFDGDGKVTTAIGSSYDRANGVALQSDNNIVVAGYANNVSTADFALVRYISTSNPVITLSYSTSVFSEASANNGSINNSTPVTITLSNDALTGTNGDNFVSAGKVTVSNLPSGLTAVVTRTSPTTVSVSLTGNASNHAAANSIANLTLAFQNSAFNSGVASAVTNATKSDLQITFNDPASNNALSFDGSNDVVSVPASSSINLSQGTWEAWVKVNSLAHHNRIIYKEGADLNGIYELYILDNNTFGGSIRADVVVGGNRYNAIAGAGAAIGTWTHIAATFDSTNFRIYVNGTLSGTTIVSGAPAAIDANTGPLGIGGNVDGTPSSLFEGTIDEVRIWNIVRTQSEIAADMNNTSLSASTTGLQAYYHFDQGTAGGTNTSITTLNDATTNANNGTLNNFALTGSSSNFISNDNPLPVELVSFTASAQKNTVELQWRTVTEVNNYGFEIERRAKDDRHLQGDGHLAWKKIGFIEGNGTTIASKQYSFTEKNLSAGKYSYRLKQIDRDGKFTYSQTVEVSIANAPKEFALEQNYPNPFNPATVISYQLPVSSLVTLKVYDAIGREVATLVNEVKEAGSYSSQFDGTKLSSGIYFARLQSGDKVQLKKMILLK
ncbi:MAG: T9SS type A sorting domain-containing protein, partial [Bacteroidetes bacterium]|nr:T9SS type A sorting domain-containing protein [Bacteroidota bacterium]